MGDGKKADHGQNLPLLLFSHRGHSCGKEDLSEIKGKEMLGIHYDPFSPMLPCPCLQHTQLPWPLSTPHHHLCHLTIFLLRRNWDLTSMPDQNKQNPLVKQKWYSLTSTRFLSLSSSMLNGLPSATSPLLPASLHPKASFWLHSTTREVELIAMGA